MDTLTVEIEIPDWVRWIAQDAGGMWCCYSKKPKNDEVDYGWTLLGGDIDWKILYKGKKPKNWKDELYTWG